MATGESYYFARPSRHHFPCDHVLDFEESDILNTTVVLSDAGDGGVFHKKQARSSKGRKSSSSSSLPMNIPEWSKILRENMHDDEGAAEEEAWFPPHEFLARRRKLGTTASFSVHEGIGRTLKGRDLSRVRNAVWKQTGFED